MKAGYLFIDLQVPTERPVDFAMKPDNVPGKDTILFELIRGAGHAVPLFIPRQNADNVFGFLDKKYQKIKRVIIAISPFFNNGKQIHYFLIPESSIGE